MFSIVGKAALENIVTFVKKSGRYFVPTSITLSSEGILSAPSASHGA